MSKDKLLTAWMFPNFLFKSRIDMIVSNIFWFSIKIRRYLCNIVTALY